MNIAETSNKKKNNRVANIIKYSIIGIVLLLIVITALIVYGAYTNKNAFKVVIDGKTINLSEDSFIIEGNNVKVKIKDIAPYLGEYSFKNGQYGRSSQYTEDKNSCYLESNNEVVSYTQNSKAIEKVVISEGTSSSLNLYQNDNLKYEEYDIETPVEMINNNLYTTLKGISVGCNVQANYKAATNTVTIYTLQYLTNYYTNLINQAAVYGEDIPFSNKKALLYGWVVVKDDKENYGVNTTKDQPIIGEKYKTIKFIESTKEFIVQTMDNKMGIITIGNDNESKTKISPAYDSITEINEEMYLVSNNNKYGIINKNNQTIVNVEYDEIGINMSQLAKYDLKNGYILYNDCIAVKKDKLWGFISKSSRSIIVDPIYEEIGCIIGTTEESAASSMILVPEYEGIVVKRDGKYGLINSTGKVIIQPAASEFYTKQLDNKINYFFVYNGETLNLIDFLKENNIQPTSKNTDQEENKISETN